MTAAKITCLLKDSIAYGSQVYRNIVGENGEQLKNRIFRTDIKFLPTEPEVQRFELILNQAMNTTPEMTLFLDPFRLLRIAREDVKLAETLFRQSQKKMLIWKQETTAANQEATFKAQLASATEGEKEKQNTESLKGQIDLEKARMEGESGNKNAVLAMVTSMLSKGEQIPPYLMPLINSTVENIMIPLVAQNEEQKMAIMEQMKQAQMQQQQPQEQMQQQEPIQPEQSQPPIAA